MNTFQKIDVERYKFVVAQQKKAKADGVDDPRVASILKDNKRKIVSDLDKAKVEVRAAEQFLRELQKIQRELNAL